MNENKSKLGRGLSALLLSKETDSLDKDFMMANITSLKPNKEQPRKNFRKNELEELSNSIKTNGMLQPIIVRKKDSDDLEIVAGERRWRAAQLIGMHKVPVITINISDAEVIQIALIENIQRENLNPVEEAKAYKKICENNNTNHEELTKLVGKSRSHISNTMRLLELDEQILKLIEDGKLSMGHARTLIGVPNAIQLAHEIINKKLSVRDIERSTSKFKKTHKKSSKIFKDPNISNLEKELSEKIGLKTTIEFNKEGSSGSITLFYSDLDQLDDIMKRLKK